jgi:hypothetical protein
LQAGALFSSVNDMDDTLHLQPSMWALIFLFVNKTDDMLFFDPFKINQVERLSLTGD